VPRPEPDTKRNAGRLKSDLASIRNSGSIASDCASQTQALLASAHAVKQLRDFLDC
jgi:hypothetical protein